MERVHTDPRLGPDGPDRAGLFRNGIPDAGDHDHTAAARTFLRQAAGSLQWLGGIDLPRLCRNLRRSGKIHAGIGQLAGGLQRQVHSVEPEGGGAVQRISAFPSEIRRESGKERPRA